MSTRGAGVGVVRKPQASRLPGCITHPPTLGGGQGAGRGLPKRRCTLLLSLPLGLALATHPHPTSVTILPGSLCAGLRGRTSPPPKAIP